MAEENTLSLDISALLPHLGVKANQGPAVLVQVYPQGPNMGRRFPLERDSNVVGRGDNCEVPLREDGVSRQHARIYRVGEGWHLEDLGSTNGSFVNDERTGGRLLHEGDRLGFGKAVLKFLVGTNVEAAYHEAVYNMTVLDALTGVHNKRYLLEFLLREVSRAQRHGQPLSVVMFDIDHFKQVNDTYGHLAGDAVLRELGRRLRPRVRQEDLLARYGGEEFSFVLPSTNQAQAVHFAEDVRQIVDREPFRIEQLEVHVTVSLGVAEIQPGERDPLTLIARADQNLYAAKRQGRNRVVG